MDASTHLEHFHVYSKAGDTEEQAPDEALDSHTDAGLFLAFAPAHNCHGGVDSSLFVDGSPVTFPANSVVIMLGAGAEHWLLTDLPLRATHHAVKMRPGDQRAWYGMSKSMHFRSFTSD